ncbi:MerR family transcriptional regulator [Yanshouia hominis]|uniref:MerR family transcriptional regulator n=1 Tax=Yanshouia hominis TaxID=2763673 RepID=A0ABR7NGK8_9FIRM|nr:MerR family transcriptional regulator [Yanshouia hominis]MBC8575540.1 MerR family transcriptional regulator [Yanshouia hominis]
MKIGEISKLCNVNHDTLRYYISLGLLNPQRKNNQYIFYKKDLEDLLYIQKLKGMCFSLKEIETIMRFQRTSNWVEPNIISEYSFMLKAKKEELVERQAFLQTSIDLISEELQRISHLRIQSQFDSGVPLRALPLLVCPKCRQALQIEQATFVRKYVKSGLITCTCGYSAVIDHGIIVTNNRYTAPYDSPDTDRALYRTLCSDLLKMYQQCCSYIFANLSAVNLQNKVVFEGNINGYFFLYNHFSDLPKDCLYIIVDKYPETILMYKSLIEKLNLDLDILYIADASNNYPLRAGCVDICIDFFSSNEHQFYHPDNLPHAVKNFLAERAQVIGSYMQLLPQSKSRTNVAVKYPECSHDCYLFGKVEKELVDQGFHIFSEMIGSVMKTQNKFSFTCHVDNDPLCFYCFSAKRP